MLVTFFTEPASMLERKINMKKNNTVLLLLLFISTIQLNAQVYKRLVRLDSVGYYSNYPPYLHSSFSFKYPNNSVGNREEIRGLLPYYDYPNDFYEFCKLHTQFMFNQMKDSINPFYDTVYYFTKSNTNFTINNFQNISMKNGRITKYFDGNDTTGRFTYNNNNQLISSDFTKHQYNIDKINYTYNNVNLLEKKTTTFKNNNSRYFEIFKYNGSGQLIEKIDSNFDNTTLYLSRQFFHYWGNKKIIKHQFTTISYDDSFYYNSNGLLDSINSTKGYDTPVYYYYDSLNYLDSVVYKRVAQRDVVKLYWETYSPSVASIKANHFNGISLLRLYPNPSDGHFTIDLKKGSTNVSIKNTLGQVVKEMELVNETNSVDLSDMPAGIYFLYFKAYNEVRKIILY